MPNGIANDREVVMFTLFAGVVIEVVGTSMLAVSDGFRYVVPTLGGLGCWAAALWLFMRALRTTPVASAYAIWSGAGTALLVGIAWFRFGQRPGIAMLAGYILIVAGLGLLRNSSLEPASAEAESGRWAG